MLFVVPVLALAQAVKPAAPVTRLEFFGSAGQMESAMNRVLGLPVPPKVKIAKPEEPVTRAEVAAHLVKLFNGYRPKIRLTPRPAYVQSGAIEKGLPASLHKDVRLLVQFGVLDPVCPLIVGPGQNLTAKQAGNTIGQFFSRLLVLTQKPSPKWTPAIQPLDEG